MWSGAGEEIVVGSGGVSGLCTTLVLVRVLLRGNLVGRTACSGILGGTGSRVWRVGQFLLRCGRRELRM